MKNRKWLLVFIVAFPSFFWLVLETSTINSRKLPFYGPKKVIAKGDTVFYKVSDRFYSGDSLKRIGQPLYALVFINSRYKKEAYRLDGLWEYLNYKKEKIEHIPIALVAGSENGQAPALQELQKLKQHNNVFFYTWNKTSFDSLIKTYFAEKPYYIDYSFFVLVDANRNVRGYYDARYIAEIKRLIEEYQHLRLKEEKQKLIESNEIRNNS